MGEAAARETSMEDILSSIRRIIDEEGNASGEDQQTAETQTQSLEPQATQSEPEPEAAPVESPQPAEASSAPFEQQPAEVVEETVASPTVDEPEQEVAKANSAPLEGTLADIAASIKGKVETPASETSAVETSVAATSVGEAPVSQAPVAPDPEPVAVSEPAEPQVTQPIEPQSVAAKPVDLEITAEKLEEEAFRGALMSPSSDDAVAGAFDRLKRSAMDDIDAKTEAILRPMLREWLDENLPTMVERLVREEIERVARGV